MVFFSFSFQEHNNSLNDLTQYSLNNELSFLNMLDNNYAVGSPISNAAASNQHVQELPQYPINDIEGVFSNTSSLTSLQQSSSHAAQQLLPSYPIQQKPADQF